ncbi:MAG: mandelate racemase/muconate lactonizing enzyme family protein [Candidatus Bathyarchaeia archaeon]
MSRLFGQFTTETTNSIPHQHSWSRGASAPDEFAEKAVQMVKQGFTAIKFDPFGRVDLFVGREEVAEAVERVRAVREAVGDGVDILIEGHRRMSPMSAIRMAREIERFGPFWLEEPVSSDNIDALAKVTSRTNIPVVTGECLYSKYAFREVFEKQAADIINPDLCNTGGILECREISAMAEAYYVAVAPHNYNGPVGTASAVHLSASIPNFLILEFFVSARERREEILKQPIKAEGGYVTVPTKPGLGVEIDEEAIAKYPYREYTPRIQPTSI